MEWSSFKKFCESIFFPLSFLSHLLSIKVVSAAQKVIFSAWPPGWENTWEPELITVREMFPLMATFLLTFQFHSWQRWNGYFLRFNLSISGTLTRANPHIFNMHSSLLCAAALEADGEETSWVQSSLGCMHLCGRWEMATQTWRVVR